MAGSAFGDRVRELQQARGRSPGLEVGDTAPDAATVTEVVRALTDDPTERARLAEELHQLAGTAVRVADLGARRVLVMAGSRHDIEARHLHALDDDVRGRAGTA